MNNNTPDYINDLVFEPKMTWEDLVTFCKSRGGILTTPNGRCIRFEIYNCLIWNHVDGNGCRLQGSYTYPLLGCDHRTYEQMKIIVENLFDEVTQ